MANNSQSLVQFAFQRIDSPGASSSDPGRSKRVRIARASKACIQVRSLERILYFDGLMSHQCRLRKSKCGASPPAPCPTCIEHNTPCQWSDVDGRSTRKRCRPDRRQDCDYADPRIGANVTTSIISPASAGYAGGEHAVGNDSLSCKWIETF